MLYNKNKVSKTNDKKILHKVGKQWKVVSVALLMAVAGGAAVATTNNANADATDTAATNVQAEANSLENDHYTPASSASASSKASSASAKAPVLPNVQYAPSARVNGANASAASYNAQDQFDQAEMSYYGPTVKSYVNSINAKFPAEANNLRSAYNSASVSAANDAKSAKSYSLAAANSSNASVVNSLASAAGFTPSAFIDNVKYQASSYASSVQSASDDTYAMTLAYSLVGFASSVSANNSLPEMSVNASVNAAFADVNNNDAIAYAKATEKEYKDAVTVSGANLTALTNATINSMQASGAAKVALAHSASDAGYVNSLAKSLSGGTNNFNSSAVSSEVSYYANLASASSYKFTENFSYAGSTSSSNASSSFGGKVANLSSADNTSAVYDTMAQVISDTAAMNSAYSAKTSDDSIIASATAAKSGDTANVTSASLTAKSASGDLSGLAAKANAADVANIVLGHVSAETNNGQHLVAFAKTVLHDLSNKNALEADFGLPDITTSEAEGVKDLAAASGVDVKAMLSAKPALGSVASAIQSGVNAAMSGKSDDAFNNASALSSAMSSENSAVASAYTSAVSASNSYARSTDEDVTLASYYASSYADAAKSEASAASNAANDLNNFYLANADAKFASADAAYNTAKKSEPNDALLAHAFGVFVLHNCPQFVTVTKNAMLHSAADYSKDNAVKSVKVGESFAVKGVAFDEAGNIRYVVGESDNQPVYLTANDAYVQNTYLEPENEYTVKFTKDAQVHKNLNFNSPVVSTVKAGQQVTGTAVATVNKNTYDLYYGVARLQVKGGYVTANQKYFTVLNNNSNDNDNSESNKSNNNYVRDLVLFK